ncbi:MAG: hypothetical protein IJB97_01465 [Clostridia bacterium]|nr:hypothetical protein [Clostridia bacterium]
MSKNNVLNKIISKPLIVALVSLVLVVASIFVAIFAGFNTPATMNDANALTVRIEGYADVEEVKGLCDKAFSANKVEANYVKDAEMSGQYNEIVYVFDADVKLDGVVSALETSFGALEGTYIQVSTHVEKVAQGIPAKQLIRMGIAAAVFCVLAFLYVALRHKLAMAIAYTCTTALGGALTFALVTLCRIPVSSGITYLVFFGMFVTAIGAMLTYRKVAETANSDEGKNLSAKDLTESSLATKEILILVAALALALVFVGAIATTSTRLFALNALLSLVSAAFAALVIAPALYIPLKANADKKAAERARYDYKKDKKTVTAKAEKEEKEEKAAPAEVSEN